MIIKVTYNVTDVYMSTTSSPIYINVSYGDGGGGAVVWGQITGTLSDQVDLQAALDGKFDDPTGTTSQYIRGDGSLATFPDLSVYVPYTGATANVDLGEYELKAGQIELDQSPTGTAGVAVTRWNDTIGSTETTLKGGNVVLKNGVDLIARVVNKVTPNTTLTKAAYQAVRISGAQGQRLAVELAQANNDNNSADTIGLVTETIATNQEGFIMTVGSLEGINTTGSLQGETWADGDVLYLSPTTPGAITNVKPLAPQHLVIIGYVEYSHAINGKIYVKVMNGWELGELHDVDTTGATNGQVLTYNGSIWTPSTNASGNIYTTDGTLTGNRVMSSGGFTLTLNPDTSLAGSLFGNTSRTRTAFGTSSTQTGTVFANVDLTFPGTSSQNNTLFMGQQQITNTGSGSSLVYGQGIDIQQHLLAKSATARVQANNYILQYRGYTDDISTNAFNQMNGLYIISGHWANQTDTNIVTGTLRGYYNILRNHGGTIQNIYGYAAFADLGGTSVATQNSTTTNYFGVFSSGQVGSSQVGVTHSVSNYYGLYIAAPTIGSNGSISNRWGIYANDSAMLNVISGDTVIGSTVSAGYKLDIAGTLRVSGNSTFTTLAGSGSRMVIADANGLLSTQSIPTGNITGTGANGQITYWTGTSTQTGSNNLFWDASNNRLGIGTASPSVVAEIVSADATMNVRNTSDTGFAGMNMYDDGSSLTGSFQIGGSLVQPSTLRGNMFIGARKSTGNLIFIRGVAATQSGALFSSGNWLFQDGGTFTDAGYKVDIAGTTRIQTINAATIDTDKFLVSDSGEIKFRTGAELLSDIGGQAALTNPVTGTGTSGQVAYWSGSTTQTGSNNLFWDSANNRLGIGTNTPSTGLEVLQAAAVGNYKFHLFTGTTYGLNITNTSSSRKSVAIYAGSNGTILQFQNDGFFGIESNSYANMFANTMTGSTSLLRLFNTGNLLLQNGGTFTDGGQRLQVQGDAFIKGSGATSATYALQVENSSGTVIFRARNNGQFFINQELIAESNRTTYISSNATDESIRLQSSQTVTSTTGQRNTVRLLSNFAPTSGTATHINTLIDSTINQTGGANGITRGLYVNPTLTAAADWRSIEWSNNTGWGLYGAGTANNYLAGDTALGTTTLGTATKLTIGGSETAASAIARGALINTTLTAAANNDVLVGLDVNPTFTNGAFTGVSNWAARVQGNATIQGNDATLNVNATGGTNVARITTNSSYLIGPSGEIATLGGVTGNQFGIFRSSTTFGVSGYYGIRFFVLGTEQARFFQNTGNFLIQNGGTFTDAGFRLDVNGSARVQGAMTVTGTITASASSGYAIDVAFTNGIRAGNLILSSTGLSTTQGGSAGRLQWSSNNFDFTIIANLIFSDAYNISVGTTTGTKIGTSTSQKIGFWNATPIVQPTTAVAAATRVGGGGTTLTDSDTFDGYTLAQIVKALRNAGLLA